MGNPLPDNQIVAIMLVVLLLIIGKSTLVLHQGIGVFFESKTSIRASIKVFVNLKSVTKILIQTVPQVGVEAPRIIGASNMNIGNLVLVEDLTRDSKVLISGVLILLVVRSEVYENVMVNFQD